MNDSVKRSRKESCHEDLYRRSGERDAFPWKPHPHTSRQVVGFHLFEEVFRKNRVNGSSWQGNSAQTYSQSVQVLCSCAHLDSVSMRCLPVHVPEF